jgi:hypothetical protein
MIPLFQKCRLLKLKNHSVSRGREGSGGHQKTTIVASVVYDLNMQNSPQ